MLCWAPGKNRTLSYILTYLCIPFEGKTVLAFLIVRSEYDVFYWNKISSNLYNSTTYKIDIMQSKTGIILKAFKSDIVVCLHINAIRLSSKFFHM